MNEEIPGLETLQAELAAFDRTLAYLEADLPYADGEAYYVLKAQHRITSEQRFLVSLLIDRLTVHTVELPSHIKMQWAAEKAAQEAKAADIARKQRISNAMQQMTQYFNT